MIRTSITHPLKIGEVAPGPGMGKIGVTFCPGKQQPSAATGSWARDLARDLGVIADWNAAAVVTLVEDHELASLGVIELGAGVKDRHMAWYHLPIPDVSVPGASFEQAWHQAGEELRCIIRAGFNVLVHCKGGLGRAGTIASRLLIELGMPVEEAITAVRKVRPGAIETAAQLAYVRQCHPETAPLPDASYAAREDRAAGALVGLAVGDAIGTTLEFKGRDTYPRLTDMVGGGPFKLTAGQWTDDTAMALALADSLLVDPALDATDLMTRFLAWYEKGDYSCTGHCFDIGMTTRQALTSFKAHGDPVAGSLDPRHAGNGSLMRLAPVAIRHWQDQTTRRTVAAKQSRTTHGAAEAVNACIAYADMLADAIAGLSKGEVLRARHDESWQGAIPAIMAGAWRGRDRYTIRSSGYVVHALEASLWCVARTGSFADAVLLAANLGDDADTTAAITGQLAGALYGLSGIPHDWREKLAWSKRIEDKARQLFAQSTG